jgi:hypothetical protein
VEFTGLASSPGNIQNTPIGPAEIYGSTARGVRLVGCVNPGADSAREAPQTFTNRIGLTEGNARFGGNVVQRSVALARSIVGREGSMHLKYKF